MAWAFAKVGHKAPEVFEAIAGVAIGCAHKFNAQDISNTAWAFATAGQKQPELFCALADRAASCLHEFNPQELANTAWAFGKVGHAAPELFNELAKQTTNMLAKAPARCAYNFTAQGITNIAFAFTKVRHEAPDLFEALEGEAAVLVQKLTAQDLTDLAWAFAKAGHKAPKLFDAFASRAAERIQKFSPGQLVNIAWAFTQARHEAPQFFEAFAEETTRRLHDLSPQELAKIAKAFAKSQEGSYELFDAIKGGMAGRLDEFTPQDIATAAWAFAKAGHGAPELFDSFAEFLTKAPERVRGLAAQDLSSTAWAFAKAGHSAPDLFRALAVRAVWCVREFVPQGLATIAWAYARAGHEEPELFAALADEAIGREHKCNPQELSNIAWAFATVGHDAPELFAILAVEAERRLHHFNAQDLANTAWAHAKAGHGAPKLFEALADEAAVRISEMGPEELVAIACAFATAENNVPRLPEAGADEGVRQGVSSLAVERFFDLLRDETLQRFDEFGPTDLLSLSGAFSSVELLDEALLKRIMDALVRLGKSEDDEVRESGGIAKGLSDSESLSGNASWESRLALRDDKQEIEMQEPSVVSEGKHWLALNKPPFWLVDVDSQEAKQMAAALSLEDEKGELDQSGQPKQDQQRARMNKWIHKNLGHQHPLCADPLKEHGLLHRLDVETSGLLLCATSNLGLYWLRLQWAINAVDKEYICLVHGWVDRSQRRINTPIRVGRKGEHSRQGGTPAYTEIVTLAHLVQHKDGVIADSAARQGLPAVPEEDRYSLVAVKLHTGRRHQIRVHMRSIGHPLVCDPTYTKEFLPADRTWCTRNFLHTYHTGFEDAPRHVALQGHTLPRSDNPPVSITCPLPQDLRHALGKLKPVDDESAEIFADWLSGENARLRNFDTYAGKAFDLTHTQVKAAEDEKAAEYDLSQPEGGEKAAEDEKAARRRQNNERFKRLLESLPKPELQKRSQSKGLRISGTKAELVKRLISEKTPSADDQLTVVQLKEKCRERGLKVSGSKADLLERLKAKDATPAR